MPWVCTTDSSHVFQVATPDLFCTKCPPYGGILMEVDDPSLLSKNTVVESAGLYIFLLDSSGSMFSEPAFPGTPMKRAQLVSGQVSNAIFEMSTLSNRANAYVLIMLFDHTIKPFINFLTVEQIFQKYNDVTDLQADLYANMESLKGMTDINLALKTAYDLAQRFIDGEIDNIGHVRPMVNSVFNPTTGEDFDLPNVRCLIFTDGMQYTGKPNERIEGNPFENFTYNGMVSNILMAAFHGDITNPGSIQLSNIVANCPEHNEKQFFHFSNPEHTMRMRSLFRMGSGPSGYCEKCLTKFIQIS